jgi:hypothetical protein
MDVLYYIIRDRNTVKGLKKVLKQPQSTISTKLRFLKQNKFITKHKWEFEPSWEVIYTRMYSELKEILKQKIAMHNNLKAERLEELHKIIKNIDTYFDKLLLKGLLKVYSLLFTYGYGKHSIYDMLNSFLTAISKAEDVDLKKIDKNLVILKEALSELSSEEELLIKYLPENVRL